MTEEEKKAQEAAAAAAAENSGNEPGEGAANQAEGEQNAAEQAAEGAKAGEQEGGEKKGDGAQEKSRKELFFGRIRTGDPDGEYGDDEEKYFQRAMEMLDAAEAGSKKYNDLTGKMMRRYQDDPEEVAILMDYIEGMPLIDAIVKHKGEEGLNPPKEGDEGYDAYQTTVSNRKADRERYMALMDEVSSNIQATADEFNSWADEQNLDDAQRDAVWKLINDDLENISKGKFTKDILNRYRSAMTHDKDVEGAYEQGKADGKNARIEATKEQMKGSGLPGSESANAPKDEPRELTEREKMAQRMATWRRG